MFRLAQHGARKMLSIIRIAPYFLTRYPISTCVRQFVYFIYANCVSLVHVVAKVEIPVSFSEILRCIM